jgi:hypothetical protein
MDLARSSGDALRVLLSQSVGMTTNAVVPLRGNSSYFNIDTPSGLVVVHGTSFEVDVFPGGEVLFAVTHGKVLVKNDLSEVFLQSGQATTGLPGEDIEQPAYQFMLEGEVNAISASREVWKVNGVEFSVTSSTDILEIDPYEPGDAVRVKGRVLATGEWVADRIEPAKNNKGKAHFTGVIEAMPAIPGTWIISGYEVMVDSETELDKDLAIDIPVKVSFVVQSDGRWLAKEIELLEEVRPQPTATPTSSETPGIEIPTATPTPTPTATATNTPSPTVTGTLPTETPTPTMTFTPSVMPKNENSRCDNRSDVQPEGLRLAQRYQVSYEEIMDWFCKGFGFGEIDLAYELSQASGIPVSEIFRLRSVGMGWGNIKQSVSAQITPSPMDNNNRRPTPKPSKTPKPKK